MNILITGGAGFIGSSFVKQSLERGDKVVVVDLLTYAGHMENLEFASNNPNFTFVCANIGDIDKISQILVEYNIDKIINFAAESHVDNSIASPASFINTNIVGTFKLLEASRFYYNNLANDKKKDFRYIQVSTDEVYGTLGLEGKFNEEYPIKPNSPYSASKAAGDHLARAWYETYGLPTIITNCSNNYGPRQYPEKLIPVMISCALEGKKLPVYGDGKNIRDWIHVEDHTRGVYLALTKGKIGTTYCFGGNAEKTNIELVTSLCSILDELRPTNYKYNSLIEYVKDRAGHDFRYAIDDSKAVRELGFNREYNFYDGLKSTIIWYLNNEKWCNQVTSKNKL